MQSEVPDYEPASSPVVRDHFILSSLQPKNTTAVALVEGTSVSEFVHLFLYVLNGGNTLDPLQLTIPDSFGYLLCAGEAMARHHRSDYVETGSVEIFSGEQFLVLAHHATKGNIHYVGNFQCLRHFYVNLSIRKF